MTTLTKKSVTTCRYMYIPWREKVVAYYLNGDMRFYTKGDAEAELKKSIDASSTRHFENVLNAFPK